jgi:hypothetical protein
MGEKKEITKDNKLKWPQICQSRYGSQETIQGCIDILSGKNHHSELLTQLSHSHTGLKQTLPQTFPGPVQLATRGEAPPTQRNKPKKGHLGSREQGPQEESKGRSKENSRVLIAQQAQSHSGRGPEHMQTCWATWRSDGSEESLGRHVESKMWESESTK